MPIPITTEPGSQQYFNKFRQQKADVLNAQGSGAAYNRATNAWETEAAPGTNGSAAGGTWRTSLNDQGVQSTAFMPHPDPFSMVQMQAASKQAGGGSPLHPRGDLLNAALSGIGGGPEQFAAPDRVHRSTGPTAEEEKLGRDSAFGRAKETAGLNGQAALTGLTEELQRRGLGGAGYEAGRVGRDLQSVAGSIGGASRDQAISEAANKTHIADTEYAGDLSQRGQDIGVGEANAHMRQANKQRSLQMLQMILGSFGPSALSY